MVINVSDTASNRRDQIANFAEILRNAPSKQAIFEAVYRGKKRVKTVEEIANATPFSAKRVTELAKPLARGEKLFEQGRERIDGKTHTIYRKLDFVEANKRKILQLAGNKKKLESFHTKTNPKLTKAGARITISVPFKAKPEFINVDDVDQFRKVKSVSLSAAMPGPERLPEKRVKQGLLKLLGESKNPKDWGGESNDIFSTRLKVKGRLRRAAFALKGPAKTGPLVPGKMGKNGDQIQRLFDSPADVLFVQYEGEIAESVIGLMQNLALAKAVLRGQVFYGVIDKADTRRLRLAYPKAFG